MDNEKTFVFRISSYSHRFEIVLFSMDGTRGGCCQRKRVFRLEVRKRFFMPLEPFRIVGIVLKLFPKHRLHEEYAIRNNGTKHMAATTRVGQTHVGDDILAADVRNAVSIKRRATNQTAINCIGLVILCGCMS